MKLITKLTQEKILEELTEGIYLIHLRIQGLHDDLEYEFGENLLNKRIGKTKCDDKFYLTLRDQYGSILEGLIKTGFALVEKLNLNEDKFRDDLDLILNNPKIFDGDYNFWEGDSTDDQSMKLGIGIKNYWSRKK